MPPIKNRYAISSHLPTNSRYTTRQKSHGREDNIPMTALQSLSYNPRQLLITSLLNLSDVWYDRTVHEITIIAISFAERIFSIWGRIII